jgi:cell division protein FtsL
MKRIISFGAAVIFFFLIASGPAQMPGVTNEQRLLALVKEIQTQQAQIASNQTKIEGKVAEVAEAVRVARIFAGRGGK